MKLILCFAFFLTTLSLRAGEIPVKSGDKIAFMGDSITERGMGPTGYVGMVVSAFKANGVDVGVIPAGQGGNTSTIMLRRLKKDVLDEKPNWMTLSCGANDVYFVPNSRVSIEEYKTNMTAIVTQAQAAGIKVMLINTTFITEDLNYGSNTKVLAYNKVLEDLAAGKKCLFADVHTEMLKVLQAAKPHEGGLTAPGLITHDGVHLNFHGNQIMAECVLRAFGFNDAQLEKAKAAWPKK